MKNSELKKTEEILDEIKKKIDEISKIVQNEKEKKKKEDHFRCNMEDDEDDFFFQEEKQA